MILWLLAMIDEFDAMANKDIVNYYNWIVTKNNENQYYQVCAAVDPYSTYDLTQFKYSCDGRIDYSYIELKGRYVEIDAFDDCSIESYKVRNLQRLGNSTGHSVYLVALYYKNSKIAIWEIDPTHTYNVDTLYCNHHTATDKKEKKIKEMVKFPLGEAKIFNMRYNTEIQQHND